MVDWGCLLLRKRTPTKYSEPILSNIGGTFLPCLKVQNTNYAAQVHPQAPVDQEGQTFGDTERRFKPNFTQARTSVQWRALLKTTTKTYCNIAWDPLKKTVTERKVKPRAQVWEGTSDIFFVIVWNIRLLFEKHNRNTITSAESFGQRRQEASPQLHRVYSAKGTSAKSDNHLHWKAVRKLSGYRPESS